MLIYVVVAMPVMIGSAILAVDAGRMMCVDSDLQAAADAAARYAATGMATSSTKAQTAYSQAAVACAEQRVDGVAPPLLPANVQIGVWSTATRTFTPTADQSLANAVRITLTFTIGQNGSPPTFAQAFGLASKTVAVRSIAMASVVETTVTAPAMGNLWLAGMPYNTTTTNLQANTSKYDNSGTAGNAKQRPQEVSLASLGLHAGDLVSFEGMSGTGQNGDGEAAYGPDGNTGWMVSLGNSAPSSLPSTNMNGIANTRAPISSCMALFLGASAPSTTSAPAGIDFGTAASRNYTLLEPDVKQPFFVGDGKTSAGEVQRIRVPAGATRIFLGMMDAWQWNDNTGSFTLKFYRGATVSTVQ